jgi:nitroimidazol reductase NimA-like FMN-containing flavoprotein (pyridoxamine 5'-phosphate oxidase superfamily)
MARDYSSQSPTAFQRLPEYKRGDEWMRVFLREAKVGHIASTQDNRPLPNPSTFWFNEANRPIILHSNVALEFSIQLR